MAEYHKLYARYLEGQKALSGQGFRQDGNYNGVLTFSKVETHSIGADGKYRIDGKEIPAGNNSSSAAKTTSKLSVPAKVRQTTSAPTASKPAVSSPTAIGEALTSRFTGVNQRTTLDSSSVKESEYRYTPTESWADELAKYQPKTAEQTRKMDFSVPETVTEAVNKDYSYKLD